MKLSTSEHKLFELERKDYQRLLDNVSKSRKSNHKDLTITCIGNAAGSDSIIHGKPSGGMLIRFKDRNIIVDPGENSLSFLAGAGFDPYQITDVVASHSHNDHIGDLTSIVSSALQLNLVSSRDTNILVPPSLVDYENSQETRFGFTLPAYAWKGNVVVLYWQDIQVKRYDGEMIRTVKTASIGEDIKITSIEGRHSRMPVSGCTFATPLGKFAYTSDTKFFPELIEHYKDSDVLWMNINTLGLNSMNDRDHHVPEQVSSVHNHLGYVGVCKLIEAVKPKTAIVSHFGSQLLPRTNEIQEILRERFSEQKVNIYCTHTGDEFSFEQSFEQEPDIGNFCP